MSFDAEIEDKWLRLPIGEVLVWLGGCVEEAFNGRGPYPPGAVDEAYDSLLRVLAWLGANPPPQESQKAPQAFTGVAQRARGRVCFKCRKQIRWTGELVVLSPVRLPGLPMHDSCLGELEAEFGGKQ